MDGVQVKIPVLKKQFGGRPKGAKDKLPRAKRGTADEVKALGRGATPLQYMLDVMRNPDVPPARRDEMARAAAPYVHPKLAAMVDPRDPSRPAVTAVKLTLVASNNKTFVVPPKAAIDGKAKPVPEVQEIKPLPAPESNEPSAPEQAAAAVAEASPELVEMVDGDQKETA